MKTLIDEVEMSEKGFLPDDADEDWDDVGPEESALARKEVAESYYDNDYYIRQGLNPCCQ